MFWPNHFPEREGEDLDLSCFAESWTQRDRTRFITKACDFFDARRKESTWGRRRIILMCCRCAEECGCATSRRGVNAKKGQIPIVQKGWALTMLKLQNDLPEVLEHTITFI